MEEQKAHEEHHHATGPAHGHSAGLNLGPEMNLPKFDTKEMDIKGGFRSVLEMLKLNMVVIEQVARNEKLNFVALLFLIIGVIVQPLANYLIGIRVFNEVFRPLLQDTLVFIIIWFVIAALLVFISTLVATKIFNGKGTFAEFFRIIGLAYIVNVITVLNPILPSFAMLLSLAALIWLLVIEFVALKAVFNLDSANAILTIIVTIVAFMFLAAFLQSVGAGGILLNALGVGSSMMNMQVKF